MAMDIVIYITIYIILKILVKKSWPIDFVYIALVAYLLYGPSLHTVVLALPFLLGVVMLSRGKLIYEAGTASAIAFTGVYLMAQEPAYMKALGFAMASIAPAALLPTLGDRGSLEGLFRYLIISTAANGFMITGLALRDMYPDFGNFFISLAIAIELGAVPMFLWVVDVYSRSAAAGLAALASLPKLAAAYAFVFIKPAGPDLVFYTIGALSMIVGNLGALTSHDLRKVFAYSTVAHAGFALFAYPLSQWLAFLLVFADVLGKMALFNHLDKGSARWGAAVLVSNQIGIPPVLGFWPKLYLIVYTAVTLGTAAAIYILINIVLTVPYYFRAMSSLPPGQAMFPKVAASLLVFIGVIAPLWISYLLS